MLTYTVFRPAGRKYFYVQWVNPFTRKKETRSTRATRRRDAEKFATRLLAAIEDHCERPHDKLWAEFREAHAEQVLPSLADKTGRLYDTVFNGIEKLIDPIWLSDLDAQAISQFAAHYRAQKRSEQTIRAYLAHLKKSLEWAKSQGWLKTVPKIDKPPRAKSGKAAKGRAVTVEEFERMLAKTPKIVGEPAAESWRFFLRGLWLSGLRLGEALDLTWDGIGQLRIDLTDNRPMLIVPASAEKGNQDRVLPLTPEFATFIQMVPESERTGQVFHPEGIARRVDSVSKRITAIGKAAKVAVGKHTKTEAVKYASAHDLRRAFGHRWARRVKPVTLQQLMRHENIQTTMSYYVHVTADEIAEELARAELANTFANTPPPIQNPAEEKLS